MERVLAVQVDDDERAFPFEQLSSEKVTEAVIGGRERPRRWMQDGWRRDGDAIRDEETGSRWSVSGRAIDGPLAGAQLESPVSINHFWFSWNAFQN